MSTRTYQRWAPKHWDEYSLLDSGHGARLEKFGKLTLDRPDPSVVWSRGRNNLEWRDADSRFEPTSRTKGRLEPCGDATQRVGKSITNRRSCNSVSIWR